jgi:hypothetical protein
LGLWQTLGADWERLLYPSNNNAALKTT